MPKLSDIATKAGVSQSTASFVLNNTKSDNMRVSEKTRLRILEVAEQMGYRQNQIARAIRTGNSRVVGMLGGDLSEQHVGRMLSGAVKAADVQDYTLKTLRFDSFGGDPRQVIRRSSELRLMGVLALHLPEATLKELYTEATNYGYPLVLMDARHENLAVPQIISDDEVGVDLGVDHLVALGHSRIAFISTDALSWAFTMPRESAFLKAMERHKLKIPPHFIGRGDVHSRETSVRAASALLGLPPKKRPTAIFCSSDIMALATLQVAAELGISVPKQCSVLGFANLSVCDYSTPQLSTIEQPFEEMGQVAMATLLSRVQPKTESEASVPQQPADSSTELNRASYIRLPTRLVQRASTAPPDNL